MRRVAQVEWEELARHRAGVRVEAGEAGEGLPRGGEGEAIAAVGPAGSVELLAHDLVAESGERASDIVRGPCLARRAQMALADLAAQDLQMTLQSCFQMTHAVLRRRVSAREASRSTGTGSSPPSQARADSIRPRGRRSLRVGRASGRRSVARVSPERTMTLPDTP